jgi:putative ABC transport system permease protein
MGAGNQLLLRMIVLQGLIVGSVGYGLGVGLASLFGFLTRHTELSFRLPWWLMVGNAGAIVVICAISSIFSIWKVLKLEPAVVFKG